MRDGLRMKKIWQWKSAPEADVQRLGGEAGLSPLLAKLLTQRGVATAAQAHAFLAPAQQELISPFRFSEMEAAVARIRQALERRERVLIHGDYDVDGITSTLYSIGNVPGPGPGSGLLHPRPASRKGMASGGNR